MKALSVRSSTVAAAVLIGGGVLMVALWVIFTVVHGPTSFDLRGEFLGRSTPFWGMLLGGLPNLLIAFSWILLYPVLAKLNWVARMGYWMTLVALILPAIVDLLTGVLGPPLLLPVLGLGMIVTGIGNRQNPAVGKTPPIVFEVVGGVLIAAFSWTILVPDELFDRVGGFRIFGLGAFALQGIGWVLFGLTVPRSTSRPRRQAVRES